MQEERLEVGTIPTCVGNTLIGRLDEVVNQNHPRMHREYSTHELLSDIQPELSPYARGIRLLSFQKNHL